MKNIIFKLDINFNYFIYLPYYCANFLDFLKLYFSSISFFSTSGSYVKQRYFELSSQVRASGSTPGGGAIPRGVTVTYLIFSLATTFSYKGFSV